MINSIKETFIQFNSIQALPPEYQTAREIEAIRNDPRLQEKIGNRIYEIEKTPTGYRIITGSCQMEIDLEYLPFEESFVGPVRFELTFHEPTHLY